MTSNFIKMCLLNYFRFKRGMLCATEVTTREGLSDVTAVTLDKRLSYEVEVKISISDLKADFKKHKHRIIKKGAKDFKSYYYYFSNYFYFCVPEGILEKTMNIVNQQNVPYYGIIKIIDNKKITPSGRVKFVKKSKASTGSNDHLYNVLLKRVSSEVVNLHNKLNKASGE